MAKSNPTWGEERIAAELLLKLGVAFHRERSDATCPRIESLEIDIDLSVGRRVQHCGHRIPMDHRVVAKPILGGMHHEYTLERRAA